MNESAGVLLYRSRGVDIEVLLVHPGGPLWAKKDRGAWSIPKGEVAEGEPLLDAALREFAEETGTRLDPDGTESIGRIRQRAGKVVHAWAVEGDLDPAEIRSNTVRVEWPPRTGRMVEFPEVDRAEWFDVDSARLKMNPAQHAFLDRLLQLAAG